MAVRGRALCGKPLEGEEVDGRPRDDHGHEEGRRAREHEGGVVHRLRERGDRDEGEREDGHVALVRPQAGVRRVLERVREHEPPERRRADDGVEQKRLVLDGKSERARDGDREGDRVERVTHDVLPLVVGDAPRKRKDDGATTASGICERRTSAHARASTSRARRARRAQGGRT